MVEHQFLFKFKSILCNVTLVECECSCNHIFLWSEEECHKKLEIEKDEKELEKKEILNQRKRIRKRKSVEFEVCI